MIVDAVIPRIGASVTFYGTAVVRQFEMMKVFTTIEAKRWYAVVTTSQHADPYTQRSGNSKDVFTNYSKDVGSVG